MKGFEATLTCFFTLDIDPIRLKFALPAELIRYPSKNLMNHQMLLELSLP